MNRPDLPPPAGPETVPTREEELAARRLAAALEGDERSGADPEALAVARLLQAVADDSAPVDELARVRSRRSLAGAASGTRRRLRTLVRLAAAAAVVAALALPLRRTVVPEAATADLEARQAQARAAVARLLSDSAAGREPSRLDSLLESRRTALWASVSDARLESLRNPLRPERPAGGTVTFSPTPGGPS